MSVIVTVLSPVALPALRGARPAWADVEHRSGHAYVREDHNTPWLRFDGDGRFLGALPLLESLDGARGGTSVTVAIVQIRNRESIEQAVERAAALPVVRTVHDLTIDTAVVLPTDSR